MCYFDILTVHVKIKKQTSNLSWYTIFYFNSVYDLVHIWYMLSIQECPKIGFDWKCLIRLYLSWFIHGIQKVWCMNCYMAFLLFHWYVQYQRLQLMTRNAHFWLVYKQYGVLLHMCNYMLFLLQNTSRNWSQRLY